MAGKETNGSKAGLAILELLEDSPDGGLTRKELEEFGVDSIPRNRAGFYIREGVEWLKDQGHPVTRDGKVYRLEG